MNGYMYFMKTFPLYRYKKKIREMYNKGRRNEMLRYMLCDYVGYLVLPY